MSVNPFRILLADDSEDDRFLLGRALRRMKDFHVVEEVEDGEQAIAYLKGLPPYSNRTVHPFPDLLLLDLKMPRMDGFDVLTWMLHAGCKPSSVVVFSSSPMGQDVRRALELGADSYQLKPRHLEDFPVMLEKLRFLLQTRRGLGDNCPACGALRASAGLECHSC